MKFKTMQKRGLLAFFMVAPWAVFGNDLFLVILALAFLLLPFILDDEPFEKATSLTTKQILGYIVYLSGWVLMAWGASSGNYGPSSVEFLYFFSLVAIGIIITNV